MSLADILGGLGGIGEGYLRGTNQLQQLQSQQYANALRQLQLQQLVQGGGAAWGALQQGVNPMNQPGSPVPMMDQTQAQPPTDLPQVPQATGQMNSSGGGLPQIISQLESGGGRDIASQPPSMVNPLYGQYKGFADQYGSGAAGVNNFAQAELSAKPNATLGDYYADYVLGTGKPGSHSLADLQSTSVPGAQGAYRNLVNNAGVSPDTPLIRLASANQINQQIDQSIPPPVKAAAQGAATTVLRSLDPGKRDRQGQPWCSGLCKVRGVPAALSVADECGEDRFRSGSPAYAYRAGWGAYPKRQRYDGSQA
jgi:hypothetical protein